VNNIVKQLSAILQETTVWPQSTRRPNQDAMVGVEYEEPEYKLRTSLSTLRHKLYL
jgi:uncharacterized protein (UPF0147 family)